MISREKVGKLRDSVVKGGKTAVEIARPFLAEDRPVAKAEDGTLLPSRLPAWFTAILGPLRPAYREVLGHACFTNILALVVPLFTLQVYDRVVAHNSISTLWALVFGVILALGCDWALRRARARMLQATALKIDAALGRKLYAKISALPLAKLEQQPTPYWLSIFQDAAIIRNTFSGGSAVLVTDLPFAILFLGVICVIAWPIVGVLAVAIPAFLLLTWHSTRMIGERSKSEAIATQNREKLLSELIMGRATVKALSIDRARQPEWEERHAHAIKEAVLRGETTDDSTVIAQTLTLFTTVMLVVVGALAIIDKELTMGGLIAANMLAARIMMPLNQLLGQWKLFAMCKASLTRLDGVFAMEEERTETTLAREKPKGFLSAEQLTFTYPNYPLPLLNKLDFALKPGEMVGLVGKNGCGKTTLLKLLQGLYRPSEGRVLIDGADIQQFTRGELASWIGYVPQECFLFSGTL
ncbi:MAG: ATP-binding cassette domain-containing protein, partial [Alphaproteobacteria bacterium]|nr:ATP-binding cassette domain-containing protein [Alphaproteobacteria bacterium]